MRTRGIATLLAATLLVAASAQAESGKPEFEKICASCHGKEGRADTKKGQKLKAADYREVKELQGPGAIEHVEKTVRENKKHKKVSAKVSDEDLAAIAQYVQTLAAQK